MFSRSSRALLDRTALRRQLRVTSTLRRPESANRKIYLVARGGRVAAHNISITHIICELYREAGRRSCTHARLGTYCVRRWARYALSFPRFYRSRAFCSMSIYVVSASRVSLSCDNARNNSRVSLPPSLLHALIERGGAKSF